MTRFLLLMPILASVSLQAAPILIEAGDLQALINGTPIPSAASSDKYQLPTESLLNAFRASLKHILNGDLQAAADEAETANYDLVSYTDNVTVDTFALLREKNSNHHWGGLYVVDQTPERALVVQCPHPLYDGVRVPATDLFIDTNAVAYLQAGTHRNNSITESDCDGDLNGNAYRISDMAHAPGSLFQAAHEVIEQHYSQTISLSFHGMADGSDDADSVVSNGTPDEFVGNSLSRELAARLNEIILADDPMDERYVVSHQEPGQNPNLSGSTNTQGRITNGSSDSCLMAAPSAIFPERFIHLENDPDVSEGSDSNWSFVIQAFNELIPLLSDPVPDLPLGALVITEIMPNPAQVGDGTGEYIEIFNHTGAPIEMINWVIGDSSGNSATFSGTIQPGDLFMIGASADLNGGGNPGGVPDAVWTDFIGDLTLTDGGDVISIINPDGELVASMAYEIEDEEPSISGVALELAIGNQYPNGQTAKANYVRSVTPFGNDLGSPGTRGETQLPLPECHLSPTIIGDDLKLGFPAATAVTYVLWESSDLDDWDEVLTEDPIIGNDTDANFTFLRPNDDFSFYRLIHDYTAPD